MPKYKILNIKNPAYDETELRHLRSVYDSKLFEKNKAEFLAKRPAEPKERYKLRLSEASYRNYVGPIVDFFAAMLFATRPTVAASNEEGEAVTDPHQFYSDFRDDCDGNGANVDTILKTVLTTACVCQTAWVRIVPPDNNGKPAVNAAEYEKRKLGDCRLQIVEPENVIDWEIDDKDNALRYVVIHEKFERRPSILDSRGLVEERWTVLYRDRVDVYLTEYEPGKKPTAEDEIELDSSKPHSFGVVPMVPLRMAEGQHVAGRLKSPQLAHFRKSNALGWSISATCFAQPVFTLRDQTSMPTMGAGFGIIIGKDEKMEWAAPPTGHFAAIAQEVKDEKDEIFRIAQQMALGVENNAAAVGRSGESKRADAENTRVMLLSFSRVVKEVLERIYDLISKCRGDKLSWSIGGLDDFAAIDINGMLENLKSARDLGGVPSETFDIEVAKRLADALLPDVDQQTRVKIHTELEAGVKKLIEERETIAEIARAAGERAAGGSPANGGGRGGPPVPASGQGKKGPIPPGKRGGPGGRPVPGAA